MAKKIIAAKQARSLESQERLLKAALEVLTEKGLEGATIPQIASRAGLSAGAVYRRFPDKDALLQTIIITWLEENDEQTRTALTPELAEKHSLRRLVERFIELSLQSQRKNVNLIRALNQYVLSHPSAAFRRKVNQLNIRTNRCISDFLLLKRKEIKHPAPDAAVPFAIIMVALAIREIILLDIVSADWASLLPVDDERLLKELTRVFLSYLGVK